MCLHPWRSFSLWAYLWRRSAKRSAWAKPYIPVSGLLAEVSMACALKLKSPRSVTRRLSEKFGKLWLGAEVLLFVLVGAAVDVRYTLKAGPMAVAMIFLALCPRAVGVLLCLVRTPLESEGAAVLRHRLSAQGHGAGRHRLCPSGYGSALRRHRSVHGGAGHPHHRPPGGPGHGCGLRPAAEQVPLTGHSDK